MKETFYFPHDYNAFEDKKILRLRRKRGMQGYGVFRNIIERLAAEGGYLNIDSCEDIAFAMQTQCDCITSVIHDFSLFKIEQDGTFYSTRLLDHLEERKLRSNRASTSAKARREPANDTTAMQTQCDSNADAIQRKGKERKKKGKEKKENNTIPYGIDDASVVDVQEEVHDVEKGKKKKGRSEEERVAVYNAIDELKAYHEKIGVAYIADDERIFAHHILYAKSFGEHCEKLKVDRLEYAKNVLLASFKLQYLKGGVAAGPKAIYCRHEEIFNEAQKVKQKNNDQKSGGGVVKPPSLSSEK